MSLVTHGFDHIRRWLAEPDGSRVTGGPILLGLILIGLILIGVILALTGWAVRTIGVLERAASRRHPVDGEHKVHNRKVLTPVRLLRRTGMVVAVMVGMAGMLLSVPAVRQCGAGLIASAGLAGLVLSHIIGGWQIAMTAPISLDDGVMIEAALGYIEEMTGIYIVMRLWDEWRMVVPSQDCIEYPIANRSRTNRGLISSVFLWFDDGMPLEPLRQELQRICDSVPEWERKTCILQMCEAVEHVVKIRMWLSAVGKPAWWNLGCRVRAGLIDLVQRQYPQYLPTMRARLQHVPEGAPKVPGRAPLVPVC